MMALRFSSLKIWGIACISALCVAFQAKAAGPGDVAIMPGLPLTFDVREHLPLPDISSYPRIRFATAADFPPFNFADQNGRLTGFNIDLVREICAALDIEAQCEVQALPFADLESALAAGQVEAVISGVAITPERRQKFAFSRPYMVLPARFAVSRSALKPGMAVPGPDWRIGTVSGTAHDAMARAWFPGKDFESFDSQEALLDALKAGKIDAAFADALRLSFWVAGNAAGDCCALAPGAYVSERYLGEGLAIMVRPKDRILAAAFDHALSELSANGRLEEIYLRYFPQGLF